MKRIKPLGPWLLGLAAILAAITTIGGAPKTLMGIARDFYDAVVGSDAAVYGSFLKFSDKGIVIEVENEGQRPGSVIQTVLRIVSPCENASAFPTAKCSTGYPLHFEAGLAGGDFIKPGEVSSLTFSMPTSWKKIIRSEIDRATGCEIVILTSRSRGRSTSQDIPLKCSMVAQYMDGFLPILSANP